MKRFVKRIYGFIMIEVIFAITIMTFATVCFLRLYERSFQTHNNNMIEMHLFHIINSDNPSHQKKFNNYCEANNIKVQMIRQNTEYELTIKGKKYIIFFDRNLGTYCYKQKN